MRKMENKGTVQGKIYDHTLEVKQVQKQGPNFGKDFIMGELRIQVGDKDSMRIIPVRYGYTPPVYNSGKENRNYVLLKKIIDDGKTIAEDGWDAAWCVNVSMELEADDGYDPQTDEFRTYQRNRGSFLRIVNNESNFADNVQDRSRFEADVIISKVREVEETDDKPRKAILSAAVFNFRNEYMPFEMVCYTPGGIDYYLDQGISSSNPLFTKVKGFVDNSQIKIIKTEESAFREAPAVIETTRTVREWVITWSSPNEYVLDSDDLTTEELKAMLANREVHLAEVKQNRLDYEANKNNNNSGVSAFSGAATAIPAGTEAFKF